MSLLGIDYGTKRLGVAVAVEEANYLFPRDTIDASDPAAGKAALLALAAEEGATALILGLPLNADGSEGPMALGARMFGAEISHRAGLPVHLVDERYSSQEAEEHLRQTYPKDTRKRRLLRDRGAAIIILRTFLEYGALDQIRPEGAEALLEELKAVAAAQKPGGKKAPSDS